MFYAGCTEGNFLTKETLLCTPRPLESPASTVQLPGSLVVTHSPNEQRYLWASELFQIILSIRMVITLHTTLDALCTCRNRMCFRTDSVTWFCGLDPTVTETNGLTELLSNSCSNNVLYVVIFKSSYKIELYCIMLRWRPPRSSRKVHFINQNTAL